jgi:hypothetical protein
LRKPHESHLRPLEGSLIDFMVSRAESLMIGK